MKNDIMKKESNALARAARKGLFSKETIKLLQGKGMIPSPKREFKGLLKSVDGKINTLRRRLGGRLDVTALNPESALNAESKIDTSWIYPYEKSVKLKIPVRQTSSGYIPYGGKSARIALHEIEEAKRGLNPVFNASNYMSPGSGLTSQLFGRPLGGNHNFGVLQSEKNTYDALARMYGLRNPSYPLIVRAPFKKPFLTTIPETGALWKDQVLGIRNGNIVRRNAKEIWSTENIPLRSQGSVTRDYTLLPIISRLQETAAGRDLLKLEPRRRQIFSTLLQRGDKTMEWLRRRIMSFSSKEPTKENYERALKYWGIYKRIYRGQKELIAASDWLGTLPRKPETYYAGFHNTVKNLYKKSLEADIKKFQDSLSKRKRIPTSVQTRLENYPETDKIRSILDSYDEYGISKSTKKLKEIESGKFSPLQLDSSRQLVSLGSDTSRLSAPYDALMSQPRSYRREYRDFMRDWNIKSLRASDFSNPDRLTHSTVTRPVSNPGFINQYAVDLYNNRFLD